MASVGRRTNLKGKRRSFETTSTAAPAGSRTDTENDTEHKSAPGSGGSARSVASETTVFHLRKRSKTDLGGVIDESSHARPPVRQLDPSYGGATSSGLPPPQPVQSILASLSASNAGGRAGAPAFPYSLPPVSAIRSPRRALVCASLESAASASSLLTQTEIHPAILHSLSIRLQAMNDSEAEIVLQRLHQLAHHIDQQNQRNKAHLAAMHAASSSTSGVSPRQVPGASGLPPSPLPALSSISSVDSSNTSNTTSPTISPAGRATTPPGPPSPATMHVHAAKATMVHSHHVPAQAAQTVAAGSGAAAASHPPLHPQGATSSASPYAQLLLHGAPAASSTGVTRAQQLQMYAGLHHSRTSPDAAAAAAAASATIAANTTDTTTPGSASLPRGISEDSGHIPLGLLMLIEALPGSDNGPLTAAGDLAGSGHASMRHLSAEGSSSVAQRTQPTSSTDASTSVARPKLGLPPPRQLQRSTSC